MIRQVLLGLLVISLFCLIGNTSAQASPISNATIHEVFAVNLELTINYGNSTQQVYSSLSGNTVFDILNQTSTVTFTQFAYGKFVTSINDVENNANGNGYYWQYWVNDELAPVAADNHVLSDSDRVLWKYCAPEDTPTATPTLGPELWLGAGVIGTVGIIVVIAASVIYLKMR